MTKFYTGDYYPTKDQQNKEGKGTYCGRKNPNIAEYYGEDILNTKKGCAKRFKVSLERELQKNDYRIFIGDQEYLKLANYNLRVEKILNDLSNE